MPVLYYIPIHRPRCSEHQFQLTAAALCIMVAFLWSPPSYADDEPQTSSDGDETEAVTVTTVDEAGFQRDDERFASGMVTRIATDDLAFRGADLGDALASVSGVYVRRQSSRGQPAHVSIRGGNSRQMAVELDGLRISQPVGAGFDAASLGTGGIDSVDVHRGSTATTYGGGAVAGALRLHPTQASADGWELKGRASAGSFGTTGFDGAASIGSDNAGLRIHAGFDHSRGDFDFVDDQGTEHTRINNDHRSIDAGTTAHIEGDDHRLRWTGLFRDGQSGSPGPSEFQQTFDGARSNDRRALTTLRYDATSIVDNEHMIVDAYATAGAQHHNKHYENERGVLTRQPYESHSTARTLAVSGGLSSLIGDSHLARIDVDGRIQDFGSVTDNVETTRLDATRTTAAVSISDEWLLAGDTFSLVGALRGEFSRTESTDESRPLLPALGAIARVDRRLELRANIARTFRIADFDELYLDTEAVRGNPDLNPEEAWTVDTAVELGAGDDPAALQLAYFDHHIDSMILFLPVSARLFEAQNLRGARSRGLEANLRTDVGDRWTTRTSYTYTRAHRRGDGETTTQLPGQPRHRLSMESTIDLSGLSVWSELPEVQLQPSANFRSGVNLDNFGHLRNDPSLRLNFGATIAVNQQLRAGVQIRNILDDRRAQDSLHRPLPGRSLFASIEVRSQQQRGE